MILKNHSCFLLLSYTTFRKCIIQEKMFYVLQWTSKSIVEPWSSWTEVSWHVWYPCFVLFAFQTCSCSPFLVQLTKKKWTQPGSKSPPTPFNPIQFFSFPIILNIFVIFPKIMQTVFNFAYIHERGITLQNFEIFLLHFISTWNF